MRSETTEKQKPTDMLLRVIRVAQILVQGQEEAPQEASDIDPDNSLDTGTSHAQKTQN